MTTKTDGPGWVERLCYAAGGMVTRFTAGMISGFLLIYLTNVAVVSVIIGVSKFFYGISDIMVGNVIDNTRSRFGKARIWLLRMCLPLSLTLILLFWVPPQLPQFMKYVYVFLMYNIVNTVVLTFVQFIGTGASYYSLYILHDMSRLSLILTSNMIPTIAVVLLMPALIKRFGTKRLFIAGLAIAVVGFTGFALSAAGFNAAFDLQKIAQPPAVSTAISLMFIWVPAVMLIAALIIFTVFFDFKKEMTNEIGHKSAE